MKYDFYFVHGWGFSRSFWNPVKKKLEKEKFSGYVGNIDLNFFNEHQTLINEKHSDHNKIFIVHSYGLNWFLKKNPECKGLINFFGLSDFVGLQKKPYFIKVGINKMLSELIKRPRKVIEKFHHKCEVKYTNMKNLNKKNLVQALIDLKSDNLTLKLIDAKYNIISIYSYNDKVINIDEEKIKRIEKENHQIYIAPDLSDGFPLTKPNLCFEMIKEYIKKI